MRFPALAKLPKYKKFDYQPRYYDPAKEKFRQSHNYNVSESPSEEQGAAIHRAFSLKKQHARKSNSLIAFNILLLGTTLLSYLFLPIWVTLVIFPVLLGIYIFAVKGGTS